MNEKLEFTSAAPPGGRTAMTHTVRAQIGYFGFSDGHPINYMYNSPDRLIQENCTYDYCEVLIANARTPPMRPSVHKEGFELCNAKSDVSDFQDSGLVERAYYPECVELACAVTGGSSAIVFDHSLRKREAGRPQLTFGRSGNGTQPGGVGRVHNDYSEASGQRRFGLLMHTTGGIAVDRRYCIINIWRPIKSPVVDTPLAVCDARTVQVRDLVVSEIRYPDRTGEIYLFNRSDQHSWYYYPEMHRDEALVFKQYDSLVSGVARFTPHAAFDLPEIPNDAPLRESIEVRCLVLFD